MGAANWLRKVNNDEKRNHYLAENKTAWYFNLSFTPWWRAIWASEWLVSYRTLCTRPSETGYCPGTNWKKCFLTSRCVWMIARWPMWKTTHNFRYLHSILWCFIMQSDAIPELQPHHCEESDLRKRARYLQKCKTSYGYLRVWLFTGTTGKT